MLESDSLSRRAPYRHKVQCIDIVIVICTNIITVQCGTAYVVSTLKQRTWMVCAEIRLPQFVSSKLPRKSVFSSYFFVLRGGEICPLCHRKTVVESGRTGSRVTLSCTRKSCEFSFEYDRAVDLAHDPDEG